MWFATTAWMAGSSPAMTVVVVRTSWIKVFWFFFSKKNRLPYP
jgi:hypothetical protein